MNKNKFTITTLYQRNQTSPKLPIYDKRSFRWKETYLKALGTRKKKRTVHIIRTLQMLRNYNIFD